MTSKHTPGPWKMIESSNGMGIGIEGSQWMETYEH